MSSSQKEQIRLDAIVMAGDRGAYRKVYGDNKALLEINGVPVISYVLSALQRSRYVSRIFVVGPRERLSTALAKSGDLAKGPKDVVLVKQWDSMIENAWNTFLVTVSPETQEGDCLSEEALQARYRDKAVMVLGVDIPLLTPGEVDEFIEKADLTRYDYILGMTREEDLLPYYPKPGSPGIKFAYFCFKDSKERQNNLHLIRIFRVLNRGVIQKMYQYRYQKRWKNILRLMWTMLRIPEVTLKMILKFFLLQMSRMLDRAPLFPFQRLIRRFLDKAGLEQDISRLIKARFGSVNTTYGGATLDVDNEEHFQIIRQNFQRWNEFQANLAVEKEKRREGAGTPSSTGEERPRS